MFIQWKIKILNVLINDIHSVNCGECLESVRCLTLITTKSNLFDD